MADNIPEMMFGATRAGVSIADSALRYQELQSQNAERRVRERQANLQMQYLMEQHDKTVQYQADMAKAMGRVAMETQMPDIELAGPPDPSTGQRPKAPNPSQIPFERSMLKNVLPVIAANEPGKVAPFVQDMAMYPYRMAEAKRQEALSSKEEPPLGQVMDIPLGNGRTVKGVRTGRESIQLTGDPSIEAIPDPNDSTKSINVLRPGGMGGAKVIPQDALARQIKVQSNKFALENADLSVPDPDVPGGRMIPPENWGKASQRMSQTAAVKTTAESQMLKTEKTVETLTSLEKTIRPQDVGIKGVLGDELLDTWLPQFGFNTSDIQRMDNRTKLKAVIEGALREVSDDKRFSNADRADIKDVLPQAGVKESYPHAMQTISTLKRIFSKRALIDAQTIGMPAPSWALKALPVEALLESAEAGILDLKEARAEILRRSKP